jgi:hypothetical protein
MNWNFFHLRKDATLYVHFPCFDGVVSGVLSILFLSKSLHWRFRTIHPVNYSQQDDWSHLQLPRRSAVVDFLYHPQADFWADHHSTTFCSELMKADFEAHGHEFRFYDSRAGSCAMLLWQQLGAFLGPDPRLEEMARWADKIDSASYASVEEAIFSLHPAMVVSRSLAVDADGEYCRFLITLLQKSNLEEAAQTSQVQKRFITAKTLTDAGLDRVGKSISLRGNVAFFEANSEGVMMNRYAPYCFYPHASYSVGVVHSKSGTKITAMRNPWLNFESAHLGQFMRKFGGGGHQRVGSVILPNATNSQVSEIVPELLHELNASERETRASRT